MAIKDSSNICRINLSHGKWWAWRLYLSLFSSTLLAILCWLKSVWAAVITRLVGIDRFGFHRVDMAPQALSTLHPFLARSFGIYLPCKTTEKNDVLLLEGGKKEALKTHPTSFAWSPWWHLDSLPLVPLCFAVQCIHRIQINYMTL